MRQITQDYPPGRWVVIATEKWMGGAGGSWREPQDEGSSLKGYCGFDRRQRRRDINQESKSTSTRQEGHPSSISPSTALQKGPWPCWHCSISSESRLSVSQLQLNKVIGVVYAQSWFAVAVNKGWMSAGCALFLTKDTCNHVYIRPTFLYTTPSSRISKYNWVLGRLQFPIIWGYIPSNYFIPRNFTLAISKSSNINNTSVGLER